MGISGLSFTFNGMNTLRDFNLSLCQFDGISQSSETGLVYTINRGGINPWRSVPNQYSAQYSDVLSFSATLAKCDNTLISQTEERQLIAWLTNVSDYGVFTVEDNYSEGENYHTNIYYFAKVVSIVEERPMGNSKVYGLTINFTTNAPYGWSGMRSFHFITTSEHETEIIIENTSDDMAYIYPVVEFTVANNVSETQTVSFYNSATGSEMILSNLFPGITYSVDCESMIVTPPDNVSFNQENDINDGFKPEYDWLSLANGINPISISGNISGDIKFREIRKVGI